MSAVFGPHKVYVMTLPSQHPRPRFQQSTRGATDFLSPLFYCVSVLVATVLFPLAGCHAPAPSAPSAESVVDSAIVAHGGPILDQAQVSFSFRGDRYRLRQNEGRFHYQRRYLNSLNRPVRDGLTNDGPYRIIEDDTVSLAAEDRTAVKTTVNSVVYFALLPSPLQDSAVQTDYAGRDTLSGIPYHRIRVTFQQEGGGSDWEDVFLYWFRTDTYAMDYLAYAYGLGSNDSDTGTRFRAAYNVRRVNGVRFADYRNYTADTLGPDQMHRYPDLYARNALTLVSHIKLDSLHVRPIAPDA